MTTNEMIFKTLKTKATKEAKYAPILIDMGYELLTGNMGWSDYDYYTIRNPKTGRTLCISKDGNNKRKLFDTFCSIDTYDFTKVDFVKYLSTNRKHKSTEPSIYKQMRYRFERAKWDNDYHGDKIMRLREQMESLEKELDYHIRNRDNALMELIDVRDFILENM